MLYKKYQDKGLVKTRTYVVNRSEGDAETKHSTTWTEKGREFVRELLEGI
jgi:anti-repressor protein